MIDGIQHDFTNDITGVPHPESFWQMHTFSFEMLHDADRNVQTTAVFRCWHDKDAFDNGDRPIPGIDRSYPLPIGPANPVPSVGDALDGLYAYVLDNDTFFAGAITV